MKYTIPTGAPMWLYVTDLDSSTTAFKKKVDGTPSKNEVTYTSDDLYKLSPQLSQSFMAFKLPSNPAGFSMVMFHLGDVKITDDDDFSDLRPF